MRRGGWIAVAVVVLAVAGLVAYASSTATISALPAPGRFETSIATRAKDFFIHRAAAGALPPPVPLTAAAIAQGKALFGMDCATCHGQDGRHPAPI
ncbi:MAG: c-type cytochrome, partial [Terriglobales bacterium]